MKNKVTMQMIADRLHITKVSVSKALNNQPGVSEKLRSEIQRTAQELGYTRHTSHRKILGNFAFIVPKRFFLENENFYTTIYYYLNKHCQATGYVLSNIVINSREELNQIVPEFLVPEQYDGIFVAGEIDEAYLRKLFQLNIPIVLIDFYKASLNFDCIITDNFYLGYHAAVHLIANGHRKIGFVGDIGETASIMDRYYGYCKALYANGLALHDDWHLVNNNPTTGIYSLDLKLPEEMPTAFVCHCDMAAYFLMQTLKKAGYAVPGDVSLISFDDTDLSNSTTPRLTTFDINRKEIAAKAFRQMLTRVEDPEGETQRIYINNRFVERESVRRLE